MGIKIRTNPNRIVVDKIIVGRPIVSVIPSGANINDLQGIDFSDRVDGSVIDITVEFSAPSNRRW
jgi:hypothetical protein